MNHNNALSRRDFFKVTGTAGVMVATVSPFKALAGVTNTSDAGTGRVFPASPMPDRVLLSWSQAPSKSQAVTWRTDGTVTSPLAQIAQADGSPYFDKNAFSVTPASNTLQGEGWEDKYHTAHFQNLRPKTVYNYRVGDGQLWSEWFQFRTADNSDERFSFIYLGDAQNNILSAWSHVVRRARIKSPDVRFILHAGDLINHDTSDDEWGEWHAGDGWAQSGISCIATPGNHEYNGQIITPQWNHQFAFPENGPNVKSLKNTVYYIDYQGVRFISLDTTLMSFPHIARKQQLWLKHTLKNNSNRWTVITHHHPMRAGAKGRGGHPILNLSFRRLYERYNVDLVLQGHDHTYARGSLNRRTGASGPVYIVSVSGPKMYESYAPWAEVSAGDLQFYQHITVEKDILNFRTYTAVGDLFDSFDLEKKTDKSNKLIERM